MSLVGTSQRAWHGQIWYMQPIILTLSSPEVGLKANEMTVKNMRGK